MIKSFFAAAIEGRAKKLAAGVHGHPLRNKPEIISMKSFSPVPGKAPPRRSDPDFCTADYLDADAWILLRPHPKESSMHQQ